MKWQLFKMPEKYSVYIKILEMVQKKHLDYLGAFALCVTA